MRNRSGVRRTAALLAAIVATSLCFANLVSAAPASRHFTNRRPQAAAELDVPRLVFGGGEAFPSSFPSGWKRAIGWSVGYIDPILSWCDLAADAEKYSHRYNDADLRGKGATVVAPGHANFRDYALGFHVHSTAPGSRFYALAQLALPRVQRPTVFYTDASGDHEQPGVDQTGNRLGGALGLGFEQIPQGHVGGLIEGRYVLDPVPHHSNERELIVRAAITVPLPTR